jgi:RHS repeat-associated protein
MGTVQNYAQVAGPPTIPAPFALTVTQTRVGFFDAIHGTGDPTAQTVFNSPTRTTQETSFTGVQQTTVLNPFGDVDSVTSVTQAGSPTTTQYAYDGFGDLSTITQGARVTQLAYDASGFLQSIQPPEIGPTVYTRDGAGRVTDVLFPDGARHLAIAYDADGNVTKVTPPGKPAWTISRDPFSGEMTASVPPTAPGAGGGTTYQYNFDQQLTQIQRPDGSQVSFHYFGQSGLLLSKTAPEGTTSYGYQGNLHPYIASVSSPTSTGGVESLGFTYNGSLISSQQWSGEVSGSVSEQWQNGFGSTLRSTSVSGSPIFNVNYFDADGQSLGSDLLRIARDPASGLPMNEANIPDGFGVATSAFTFNEFGEQTSDVVTLAPGFGTGTGSTVYSEQLVRDNLGRITQSTQFIVNTAHTYNYTYDSAGRLASVTVDGAPFTSYVYDQNGNIVLKHTPSGDLIGSVDDQDRLLSFGNRAYTYNANGEVTQVLNTTAGLAYQLGYNSDGALVHVQTPQGAVVDYVIDGLGRRVGRKLNGALQEGYLYDSQDRVVAITNGSGQVLKTYTYTAQAHSFDQFDHLITNGDLRSRVITDIRGTPVLEILGGSGSPRAPRAIPQFDEWGNQVSQGSPGVGPGDPIGFGFAGCLTSMQPPVLPFCHLGARDYDPFSGRFLQRDPIGFGGGSPNLGTYAMDDPINFIDPTGLASCRYSIGLHTLSCTSNSGGQSINFGPGEVHSGFQTCRNNIDCIGQKDVGPVRPGHYSLVRNPNPERKKWWLLVPDSDTWFSNWSWSGLLPAHRGGFNIHIGGYSEGCITCDKTNPSTNLNYEFLNFLLESEEGANSIEVTP